MFSVLMNLSTKSGGEIKVLLKRFTQCCIPGVPSLILYNGHRRCRALKSGSWMMVQGRCCLAGVSRVPPAWYGWERRENPSFSPRVARNTLPPLKNCSDCCWMGLSLIKSSTSPALTCDFSLFYCQQYLASAVGFPELGITQLWFCWIHGICLIHGPCTMKIGRDAISYFPVHGVGGKKKKIRHAHWFPWNEQGFRQSCPCFPGFFIHIDS